MQAFLSKPKFDKKFIYSSPTTLYQEFANAYAYNKMSITCNPRPNKQAMVNEINAEWKKIKSEKTEDLIKEYIKTLHDEAVPTITCSFRSIFSSTRNTATNSISPSSFSVNQYLSIDNQVSANATEQKNALLKINNSKSKISELNNLVDI